MSNKLPSEYQEVEYIETTGTQYIDTGINSNSNIINIKTKVYTPSIPWNEQDIISKYINYESSNSGFTLGFFHNQVFLFSRNNTNNYSQQFSGPNLFEIECELNYNTNIKKMKVNDVETEDQPCSVPITNNTNFHIFSPSNPVQRFFIGRLYYLLIYENNILIARFVPCYKKSDKSIGLYDIINNQFHTNSGTGIFIKGPDIIDGNVLKQEVDWSDSMEQTFEYYEVDPISWKDTKPLTMVKKCKINFDDGADTLGSATIDMNNTIGECYIRIYLVVRQNGGKFKFVLGTFLVQTPSSSYDGKNRNVSMDAYTPLLELKENPPPLGFALLKDENIMRQAYLLVRDNCRAPVVETTSDKLLQDNFVADPSEKWLNYISDLIDQAKYRFHLDEQGRILFAPKQKIDELQPVWTYNDDNSSILFPEVTMKHDLYGIPNVVEVVCSTGTHEYTARIVNDDPNSPTSTINRGRELIYRETEPNLPGYPTEEQIDEYAKSLLESLSSVEYQVTYTHGYCPVRVGDAVRLNYKRAGLDGIKAKVIGQSITCENGCSVSETAIFTKKLWN